MNSSTPHTTDRPLTRTPSDKMVAGVSGGLGHYFGVDPVLFRAAFAAATLLSGAGLIAYLVLWVIVPREEATPIAAATPPMAA